MSDSTRALAKLFRYRSAGSAAAAREAEPGPVLPAPEAPAAGPAVSPGHPPGGGHPPNGRLEFDRETIPWLDKYYLEIQAYVDSLPPDQLPAYDLEAQLVHWMRFGYVTFPGAVDDDLIDDYLADVDEFIAAPGGSRIKLAIENYGVNEAGDLPPEAFAEHHRRIMDFHNASTAGKQLALHPVIVEFLGHVFRERVIAMQSLTFDYGTEQPLHQDFAYVVSSIPSHLAASWTALEDAHPEAGPLVYHPGSHTIEKFDWGNGLHLTPESDHDEERFASYLAEQCAKQGYEAVTFCPSKGDVFIWHAGLVHGGSPSIRRDMTRRSFVTHFSTAGAYQRDQRLPQAEPLTLEMNGGSLYLNPVIPEEEDRFDRRPLPENVVVR
jgi:phytanoyl-CoA hydroxylase